MEEKYTLLSKAGKHLIKMIEEKENKMWEAKKTLQRLQGRPMQEGELHRACAFHGKSCPYQGEGGHPIRYLLRLADGTRDGVSQHVPKRDAPLIRKAIENRKQIEKAEEDIQSYALFLEKLYRASKLLKKGDNFYDFLKKFESET